MFLVGTNNFEIHKLPFITCGRNTIENTIMQCSYADKQNNLTHKAERGKHFCFHYVRTSSGRKGKRFSFPMHEKLSKDYFPLFVFCTFETNFVGVQIDKRLENSNISIIIIF